MSDGLRLRCRVFAGGKPPAKAFHDRAVFDMMRVLLALALMLAFLALFVRSYTVPPGPDRQGGTVVMLAAPNQPLFGSPRADCLGANENRPVIACLIASVTRSRSAGIARLTLPFCLTCYSLSQRIALIGRDEAAAQARLAQIARFGW